MLSSVKAPPRPRIWTNKYSSGEKGVLTISCHGNRTLFHLLDDD